MCVLAAWMNEANMIGMTDMNMLNGYTAFMLLSERTKTPRFGFLRICSDILDSSHEMHESMFLSKTCWHYLFKFIQRTYI